LRARLYSLKSFLLTCKAFQYFEQEQEAREKQKFVEYLLNSCGYK